MIGLYWTGWYYNGFILCLFDLFLAFDYIFGVSGIYCVADWYTLDLYRVCIGYILDLDGFAMHRNCAYCVFSWFLFG